MSQTPNTTTAPVAAPTPTGDADDPLAHLHKMSTTAGLGSGDYVAVNGAAVFALLLGLASMLTMLEEILLVIPVACIVVSIIAWRQINQSNGTQTGKGLVIAGLACAFLFGGFVFAREATGDLRTRSDRTAIKQTVEQFGAKVKAGDVDGAYGMLSSRMHTGVPKDRFKQTAEFVKQSDLYGALKDTTWNELVQFDKDPATGIQVAATKMKMTLEKGNIDQDVVLRKESDGRWVFERMEAFFPAEQRPRE